MSGFVGILRTNGEPRDPAMIESLTRFLEFRGPDATTVWTRGPLSLGHALLRTGRAHSREKQPATLDGSVWLVGDVRIDARDELIAAFHARGHEASGDSTDAELVLHAYATWGEACPEHLLGDFAFALWDAARGRLFCARDPLGVKPFFYAALPGLFLFSNTLNCLRQHPDVPDELNELAIADFLLFGCNLDVARTTLASIARVPPAHTLTVTEGRVDLRRYWTLPIDEPLYFKRSSDYIDRFRELLSTAVRDRLPADRVAIFMSGGLDSTLLAAEARAQLGARDAVAAFTYVYDRVIPDDERKYATLVAAHLDISIRYWVLDDAAAAIDDVDAAIRPPEPSAEHQTYAAELGRYREMAGHARVAFYGEGPDNALHYEWRPYLDYLRRNGRWGRVSMDIVRHVIAHKRIPLLATVPAMFRARRDQKKWEAPFPAWLNADLVRRFDLRGRWEAWHQPTSSAHPARPAGYGSMLTPLWVRLLESLDAGSMQAPLDVRHPYLDLRLLRYMLAVPAMPWCRVKWLLRTSARSVLPAATLERPKTPVRFDPAFIGSAGKLAPLPADRAALIEPFVDPARVPDCSAVSEPVYTMAARLQDLGWWLDSSRYLPASKSSRLNA